MFFPDLGTECPVDEGPHVRAVGWLAADQPYSRGSVTPEFCSVLRRHTATAWAPVAAAGRHTCEFCALAATSGNLWIPAEDVVYVAPEMLVHYVEVHDYAPPEEFIRAVLACPPQGSPEFLARMRRFLARWAPFLPP